MIKGLDKLDLPNLSFIRSFCAFCAFLHIGLDKSSVFAFTDYTGWPKKVSHYQVSPLNRIKNRH